MRYIKVEVADWKLTLNALVDEGERPLTQVLGYVGRTKDHPGTMVWLEAKDVARLLFPNKEES